MTAAGGPGRIVELVEHTPRLLDAAELPEAAGEALWHHYGAQVDVEFPSPRTAGRWRLTPKGWVGFIPLSPDLGIALRPKVGVRSVFGMLEHAYGLPSFRTLAGVHACTSLEELYERIASILGQRVRERVRRGLLHAYETADDRLPYVRGRLDVRRLAATPWEARVPCTFEERTADVADNRLLIWALHLATRSGLCGERSSGHVRDAHRALHHAVTVVEQAPSDYLGRRYDRLNDDYAPMHALARFIVEHAGPRHAHGEHTMVPFILDMNRLFEAFVAAWLPAHLPDHLEVEAQANLGFGAGAPVRFVADLVLRHRATRAVLAVLDTKYKSDAVPSSDDVAQVVAYAEAWGTTEAVLVYPERRAWEARVGGVRVRALGFTLEGEIEEAGSGFLEAVVRG